MQAGYCRACGRSIYWAKTTKGRMMPVNPIPLRFWHNPHGLHRLVTITGEVAACDLSGSGRESGIGYTSHFATCPKANTFRRK